MVIIDKKTVAGIPLLEVVPQKLVEEATPTVIFLHGFTSAKEHNLHYAYLLAEKNIRVLLPEANYHGERSKKISIHELAIHFWEIILQSIHEINQLKEAYVKLGKTLPDKIGIAGTSMGAITTLGALSIYPWIRTAVSLMGSPAYYTFAQDLVHKLTSSGQKLPFSEEQLQAEFEKLLPFDLSQQPEKLDKRPLLFWHGKKDRTVPYSYAYHFYEENKNQYQDTPEKFQFILDENADHKVSRKGLLEATAWFEKYLI
ncbi:prolyl oligopeptidase family serine peptidase [Caldibacillus lycopersici]|uniref:Prolyl oligopeptidase family serine peptidase n=1 Tax=Perspicuibacillus lycopersici TaxID=1325689 RepID=A0AAE3IQD0_9BACI|nr:prolyl oligopeptidase family serine peptidase [Perspicuibacillus lycopersici]MCU9612451.1 prolyl oligopeptidase family serine peptidase [Perspicuibacillus lycopersici]